VNIVKPVGGKNYPGGGSGPAAGGVGGAGPNSNFGTQNKGGLPPSGHTGADAARQNTKASEYNSRTNHGGGP